LGHQSLFWRRAARWGSQGPEWWLKVGPPIFGWAAAACVPSARRAVRRNLHRIRGPKGPVRDARDVLATFSAYASCLAETLSGDSPKGARRPHALVFGEHFVLDALELKRGIIIVTAHTGGWEAAGPLLGKTYGLDVMLVTNAEEDPEAGALQDRARLRTGVSIAKVGDPLASLPMLRHLRGGGVIALQLDRLVPGMRSRSVPLLDGTCEIPEGPFHLAQLSGAPILPIFCARRGHREYLVHAFEPRQLPRRASDLQMEEAATHVASCMTRFLRAHPTQWFQFGDG
jgi:KDO2-lipid IV(A) lauroyltransferase